MLDFGGGSASVFFNAKNLFSAVEFKVFDIFTKS
jgi:hypothetical protein